MITKLETLFKSLSEHRIYEPNNNPSMILKRTVFVATPIFLGLLAYIAFRFHLIGGYDVETDFYWSYVPSAKLINDGTIPIDQFRGPVYPFALMLLNSLIGEYFYSGMLLSLLSALVFLYTSFAILQRLFGKVVAFIAWLLTMTNTIFVAFSYTASTDMFYNALVMLSLYFVVRDSKRRTWGLLIAAIFGALAYLTRYNGIALLLGIPVMIWIGSDRRAVREWSGAVATYISSFLILISPWGMYCLNEKGSFFYNENFKNVAFEMYAKGSMSWNDYWFGKGLELHSWSDLIMHNPIRFAIRSASNIVTHFKLDMLSLLGWWLGLLVTLGIVFIIFKRPTRTQMGFYCFHLILFLSLVTVFYGERFSFVLIPCYAALAIVPLLSMRVSFQLFQVPIKLSYVFITIVAILSIS